MIKLLITEDPNVDKYYPNNIEIEDLKGKKIHSILTSCNINKIIGNLHNILNEEILLAEQHRYEPSYSNEGILIRYVLITRTEHITIKWSEKDSYFHRATKLYFRTR